MQAVNASAIAKTLLPEDLTTFLLKNEPLKLATNARDEPDRIGWRTQSKRRSCKRRSPATGCGEIVMGTRGLGSVKNVFLATVAMKVLHLIRFPVTLIK